MAKPRESSSPKSKKSAATNGHHPTHEQIALRAYHIYLERGAAPGSEFEDWTRAERQLIAEAAHKSSRRPAPKPLKSSAAAA